MSSAGSTRPAFYRRSTSASGRKGGRTSLLVIAAAALLLLCAVVFGDRGLLALRSERAQVEELRQAVAQEGQALQTLEERIEAFERPGSEALEEVSREEYLMRRPGEQVIHLLEDDPAEREEAPGGGATDSR